MADQGAVQTVDIDPEYFQDTDSTRGSVEDELSSFTASITSSVTNYPMQHGRRYHAYKDGSYIMPNDEQEQDRLDMAHAMATKLIGDKLYLAPLPNNFSGKILDAGCGTGVWAINMGDKFPDAEIRGVDLSPIQPSWVPPNVKFEVDDIEGEWGYGEKFDYIFARYLCAAIQDWPKLMRQAFENVKPGGWVEFQDYDTMLYSEDGSFGEKHDTYKWITTFIEASTAWGRDPSPGKHLEERAKAAGFVNVRHEVFKLPIGGWPKDKRMKDAGMYNLVQVLDGIEGFCLRLFTDFLKWNSEEVQVFVAKVRKELKDKSIHMLYDYHVVWAQRPEHE
ncbi:Methyltransferase type 12 [Neofusicoccum parvum]|uniref:Methyltransferase type 12 n=1 Tax=Neofusicoccum parvum TaxID=310453 RepID=A0ACB5SQ67_9PEZI|nr:Methyltransferase type 12 [Neofusicoccum parvum]